MSPGPNWRVTQWIKTQDWVWSVRHSLNNKDRFRKGSCNKSWPKHLIILIMPEMTCKWKRAWCSCSHHWARELYHTKTCSCTSKTSSARKYTVNSVQTHLLWSTQPCCCTRNNKNWTSGRRATSVQYSTRSSPTSPTRTPGSQCRQRSHSSTKSKNKPAQESSPTLT